MSRSSNNGPVAVSVAQALLGGHAELLGQRRQHRLAQRVVAGFGHRPEAMLQLSPGDGHMPWPHGQMAIGISPSW